MIVIAKISFFVILEDRVRAQRSDALRKMHEEFVVISFFIPSCVPFGSVGKIGCWWLTSQLVVAWVVRYLLSCLYSIIRTFGEILSLCLFFVKKCNKNVVYHVWDQLEWGWFLWRKSRLLLTEALDIDTYYAMVYRVFTPSSMENPRLRTLCSMWII